MTSKPKVPPQPDPYAKIDRPTSPKRINTMRNQAFWYSAEEDSRTRTMAQPDETTLGAVKERFSGWGSRCLMQTYPVSIDADGMERQMEVPVIGAGRDGPIYQIICQGVCDDLVYRNAGGGDGSHLGHDAIFPALRLYWPLILVGEPRPPRFVFRKMGTTHNGNKVTTEQADIRIYVWSNNPFISGPGCYF